MAKPNISQRAGIRWQDDPFAEPTSTLVLTSPKADFVDIRILLKDDQKEIAHPDGATSIEQIDWAFAGHATSSIVTKGGEAINHSTWEHWVDSKAPIGQQCPVDEGDMFSQPSGLTLERGQMAHPGTGAVTPYEELWRDVEARAVGSDQETCCIVLKVDEPERSARGMVVRVGQFCQGILKTGDKLTVERWTYVDREAQPGSRTWQRSVKIGDQSIPCETTFNVDGIQVGRKVECGDLAWSICEA